MKRDEFDRLEAKLEGRITELVSLADSMRARVARVRADHPEGAAEGEAGETLRQAERQVVEAEGTVAQARAMLTALRSEVQAEGAADRV